MKIYRRCKNEENFLFKFTFFVQKLDNMASNTEAE